jgi:arylsulfatase A-like enzyme
LLSGLAISLLSISCVRNSENTGKENHPNILFIAVDDMKPDLGFYGNSVVKTPNMDQLAEKGAIFTNNHCQQAVCGPSRASLLTGRYPDEIKVWGFYSIRERNPGIITLPQYFKQNGYTTVNISKIFDQRTVDSYWDSISWSLTAFPRSEEELIPWFNEETGPVTTYFYQSPLVKEKFEEYSKEAKEKGLNPIQYTQKFIKPATECMDLPDDAYKDGVFAKKAISDLEMLARKDQPFFLAVGFERPHLPWTAPEKYWDLYARDSLELSENQEFAKNDLEYFYTTSNELRSYSDEQGNFIYEPLKDHNLLPQDEQRKLIHGYYAAVSYIDAQIGKIVKKLEELDLADNTIIIIWGDHGYHLGDHGIWGKSTNFEQATRSPMLIKVPGGDSHKIDHATEFVDIYPTLCDLAGLEIPDFLSGESLRPYIEGQKPGVIAYAFSQYPRDEKMGYAIRDERYRYVEWINEAKHVNPESHYKDVVARQLFDYKSDPLEKYNIAGKDSIKEVQSRLAEELHRYYESLQD